MTEKFPKIELPFPYRPKKRKKDWVVGATGLNLSPGKGFGNPIGGSSGNGTGNGGTGAMAMGESIKDEDSYVYKYSCAMLNLSDNVSPILQYWCKKYIPSENLYVNEDQGIEGYVNLSHVTIKYGLHDTNPQKLIAIAKGYGPIEVKFGPVEKFDTNPEFDVIKVNIDSDKLRYLNNAITKDMEHSDQFNTYKPHATLAYVKKGSCDQLVGNDFFESLFDTIAEIYFASKDGQEHFIEL